MVDETGLIGVILPHAQFMHLTTYKYRCRHSFPLAVLFVTSAVEDRDKAHTETLFFSSFDLHLLAAAGGRTLIDRRNCHTDTLYSTVPEVSMGCTKIFFLTADLLKSI